MKLVPLAAAILAIAVAPAVAEQRGMGGMSRMGGMSGMGGMGGMAGMGGMSGMDGMGGMAGKDVHMHYPVDATQGAAGSAPIGGPDQRLIIELTAEERDFVLGEMRTFLDSVQGIVQGVADGDVKTVAAEAKKSGMLTMQRAPQTLMGKMPDDFRRLGMDTHMRFDALASEASGMGDKQVVLKQLAGVLANCAACHQGYRLTAK